MKYAVRAMRRVNAAVLVQSAFRRFSDRRMVVMRRKLMHFAVLSIQRVCRSFLCRLRLHFNRAAMRIQGFMRMVYQIRWGAAVRTVSSVKATVSGKEVAAVVIQCAIRRFLAMRLVRHIRVGQFIANRCARVIQRAYRWFKRKLHSIKTFYESRLGLAATPAIDDPVCTAHLASLIYDMYASLTHAHGSCRP